MSETIPSVETTKEAPETEPAPKTFTLEEVAAHSTKTDVWIVIRNKVYDVTKWLSEHPGGQEVLLEVAGKDATKDFEEVGHSSSAEEMMKKFYVGDLQQEGTGDPIEGEGVVAFTSCFKSFKSITSRFGFK